MMTAVAYEAWYKNTQPIQFVEQPIDTTLKGLEALIADPSVHNDHKAAALQFLRRKQNQYYASHFLAVFCAVGAAFSSMAYFLLIRDHSLDLNEWEYLIAPCIVGLFVAGATWYTYRHDTAEWLLDIKMPALNDIDSRDYCVYMLTFLVVAMEIALSAYGVTELNLGDAQTAVAVLVCFATLLPEWAQTHKYLDRWMHQTNTHEEQLEGHQQYWLNFYKWSSVITLGFWGMAIYPLLEENSNGWIAAGAVVFYVLTGKPYMKEKAHEQVKAQFAPASSTTEKNYWYPIARIGNGIGDLAFSAYGFFETLKAFCLMDEDEKVKDSFTFCGGGDETAKTWLIIVGAVIVVSASCVGSYLLSAGGDQKSYGEKLEKAVGSVPYNKQKDDTEAKPPPVRFSIWHKKEDAPTTATLNLPNMNKIN